MNEINIISSDARYNALCNILKEKGYDSRICEPSTDCKGDIIILPIKSALTEEEFKQIFQGVKKSALVFSGEVNKIRKYFDGEIIDYSRDERFVDKNAYITAECIIAIALSDSKKTLSDSMIGIIGYGRIGRHLTRILVGLGTSVTVFARREESRREALMNGAVSCEINTLEKAQFDIIINTVPKKIITKEQSEKIGKNTLVYDIASLPGGFEDESFPQRALALPGKMMPTSAGKAIYDFVEKYISNERS